MHAGTAPPTSRSCSYVVALLDDRPCASCHSYAWLTARIVLLGRTGRPGRYVVVERLRAMLGAYARAAPCSPPLHTTHGLRTSQFLLQYAIKGIISHAARTTTRSCATPCRSSSRPSRTRREALTRPRAHASGQRVCGCAPRRRLADCPPGPRPRPRSTEPPRRREKARRGCADSSVAAARLNGRANGWRLFRFDSLRTFAQPALGYI